jgi:hypothetical protein
LVNNTSGSGTGTGGVVVNTGGTLGGTGIIDTSSTNTNVTINAGGSLAPGASAGTLTIAAGTGEVNLSSMTAGGLKFELNTPAASDKVVVSSGTLNLGTLDFSDFAFSNLGSVAIGNSYTLFDAASSITATPGTLSGTFGGFAASLVLDNTNFDVKLNITGTGGILGDYNGNNIVDAADYVMWRNNVGQPAGTLPNDNTGVAIGQQQYNLWRSNFGNSAPGSGGSLAGAGGAVPEPSACILVCFSAVLLLCGRRSRPA